METLKFYTPAKLPQIVGDISDRFVGSQIINVPIQFAGGSSQRNCSLNVDRYIAENGGSEKQYGWIYAVLGNVLIRFVAHVVVKKTDGALLCVTQPEEQIEELKFIKDDRIADEIPITNRLPVVNIPLVRDPCVIKFCKQANEIQDIRAKYPARKHLSQAQDKNIEIDDEDMIRLSSLEVQLKEYYRWDLLRIARKHTSRNNLCYCGSNIKFKNCCNK